MVHIRFPTLQDVNACFQLNGRAETLYVWQIHRSLEEDRLSVVIQRVRLPRPMRLPSPQLGESLIRHYEQRDGIWVAVDEGQVVGCVDVDWGPEEGLAWIRHLIVDVSRRREGIGSRLLERALDAAARRGLTRAMCIVDMRNDPAIQFLRRRGFAPSGYNDAYLSEGNIALYLSRLLRRRLI